MSKIDLTNSTEQLLCVWLEPWGRDIWLRPRERVTIASDDRGLLSPGQAPFEVDFAGDHVSVCANGGHDVFVYDVTGAEIDCGYQRPDEVQRQ